MIKISYSDLSHPNVEAALKKLARAPLRAENAYKVKKLLDKAGQARKQVFEEYMKDIVNVYAEKDADGKPLRSEAPGEFKIVEDKKEAYKKAEEEFGKRVVTIDRDKLNPYILDKVEVTASEVDALEYFFDFGTIDTVDELEEMKEKVIQLQSSSS